MQHLGKFGNPADITGIQHFRNDRQAGFFSGFGKIFQALQSQSLKSIGGSPGLESATAENVGSGGLDRQCRFHDLIFAFDTARPGNNHKAFAKNGISHLDFASFFTGSGY
ncbi:MAG: hypothetical protein A4E66_02090 [Syntrophus sp. PtaB.Bin001]|nr:MAG: hypothetical protein A4E66_02090 [Syntrophus sp. PtaB.Bin001]